MGDRSPHVLAHDRIPVALRHALPGPPGTSGTVDPYWIASGDVRDVPGLASFDGIWLVPGSPYADQAGALHAVEVARTAGVPFLGTCGGFQHAVLEFARTVCGLHVDHGEQHLDPEADLVIVPLTCSLVGEEATVDVRPGTRAAAVLGAGPRTERFFCAYGLDDRHRPRLEEAGLVFPAADPDGAVRMLELPGHPFFLASLFQPELSSDATWVHPLIRAFAAAAADRAAGVTDAARVRESPVTPVGSPA